jgi:predicted S18 family serine protease
MDYESGNYALCLFRASKSKAQASVLLGVMGRDESAIEDLMEIKMQVVEQEMARFSQDYYFPIVGYSYYEYAQSLRNTDPYSALLYLEYALEVGNLDLYFTEAEKSFDFRFITKNNIHFLVFGFFVGCLITYVIMTLIIHKSGQNIFK